MTLLLVAGSLAAVRRRHFRALVVGLFATTIAAGWATLWAGSQAFEAVRLLLTLSSLVVI